MNRRNFLQTALGGSLGVGLSRGQTTSFGALTCMGAGADREPRVYVVGSDQHIHELSWWSNTWHERDRSADVSHYPAPGTPLACMGSGPDRNPRVYYYGYDPNPAPICDGYGSCDTSNFTQIDELSWWNGEWHWKTIERAPVLYNLPVLAAAAAGPNNDPRVLYTYTSLPGSYIPKVTELSWSDGAWHESNTGFSHPTLNSVAGVSAAGSTDIRIFVGIAPYKYYGPQPILELSLVGDAWNLTDLIYETGAPPHVGAMAAMGSGSLRNPRIYYVGPNGYIYELAWFQNAWHFRNIMAEIPAPVPPFASAGSPLATFGAGPNNDPRVYYVGADASIHELSWFQEAWHGRNLNADAPGGPQPAPGSPLTCMGAGFTNDPRVFYFANDGKVHEFAWRSKKWHAATISAKLAG